MWDTLRFGRKLTFAALAIGIFCIGWVARTTWAQNPPVPVPQLGQDAGTTAALQNDPPVPQAEKSEPAPEAVSLPPQQPSPSESKRASAPGEGPRLAPAPSDIDAPTAPAQLGPPPAAPESPADDPEKAALSFAQENQKLAESHVKALKDEEAKLRARLAKVEAGIKRWERLLAALKQSQAVAGDLAPSRQGQVDRGVRAVSPRDSDDLVPVDPDRSFKPKAAARVKGDDSPGLSVHPE
jgi:hypothetical protein